MNSFFELIEKIPKTVYETEKGISRVPVTNLIENGLCNKRLPALNGYNGNKGEVEAAIIDVPDVPGQIGPCMRIKKMSLAPPVKEGYYFLGNEKNNNGMIGSGNYIFSLDIWIPGDVPPDKIYLQIRYVELGSISGFDWKTLEINALEYGIRSGEWQRFVLHGDFRFKVRKTELRIFLKRGFPPGGCVYIRCVQLEEGTSPSFYCNSPGTWHASWISSDISKLFNLYSSNFDEMAEVIKDLEELKNIDIQNGAVLDEIGNIVKEPRNNRNDTEYRNFLKIAIRRNVSNGTIGSIGEIVKMIISDDNDFEITELITGGVRTLNGTIPLDGTTYLNPGEEYELPASFKVNITGPGTGEIDRRFLEKAVHKIKGAGIKSTVNIM